MSTKVTIVADWKEDFHLYFDYADFDIHLEINGKEIKLPKKLREWIYTVWSVEKTLIELDYFIQALKERRYYLPLEESSEPPSSAEASGRQTKESDK